jgi:hypothetical protein
VATELQATIACTCGRAVTARAKDAGGSIACSCGKLVAVPRLSELRTLAGADAFTTNPAEAIRKLQNEGLNPAGHNCLGCGSPPAVEYRCVAVCEKSYLHKNDVSDDSDLLTQIFTSLLLLRTLGIALLTRRKTIEMERRGHDIQVSFTLPL